MVRANPEVKPVSIKRDLSDEYKRYIMQNSSNKFHKDIPIVKSDNYKLNGSYSYNEKHQTLDPKPQLKQYQ